MFSAGGVMAALFIPAIVLTTGFLLPTEDATVAAERYQQLNGAAGWWPVKIVLFGVISLSMFHCAHRIRHTLMDLGLRAFTGLLMLICYIAALAGTVVCSIILWRL